MKGHYATKEAKQRARKKYDKSPKGKYRRNARRIVDNELNRKAKEKYYNAIAKVAYYKTCIAVSRIQNVSESVRHEIDTTN